MVLQVSFQSLSLHCSPHYLWSGAGLDLWGEAISGSYGNHLTVFHIGRLTHILPLRTWRAPLIDL